MMFIVLLLCVTLLILVALCAGKFPGSRGRKLPPGPPTLPLIGNLHQLPKAGAHFKFTEWAHQYGGIFSLKLGPATAIVISSPRLIKALMDKKSSIYSNRPPSYVLHDLITRGENVAMMPQSDKWRLNRKLVHQHFQEAKCDKEHVPLQNAEAVQMLNDFCEMPGQVMSHPKRFSNSIIMSLVYGIRSSTPTDPHLIEMDELLDQWSELLEVGATPPVDILPILKWVPERVFGNWITRSLNVQKAMDKLYGRMASHVMQRRLNSGSRGSFLDGILDQQEKLNLTRNQVNFFCGAMLEGGSESSASMILVFIQAMIRFPHVQKKAQQQIDGVLGEDRSPLWSDYPDLPYVSMIVKETLRWRPVAPLPIPHALTKDDTIDGMEIPAGSAVIMNVWALHHDPVRFPNPDIFDPERFTNHPLLASEYAVCADFEKRDHWAYGAGRRLCPGVHLAERNMFLGMAKLLWAFDFSEKVDAQGKALHVDVDAVTGYTDGLIRSPKPFEAEIKPRSEQRRATILKEYESVKSDVFSKYEVI